MSKSVVFVLLVSLLIAHGAKLRRLTEAEVAAALVEERNEDHIAEPEFDEETDIEDLEDKAASVQARWRQHVSQVNDDETFCLSEEYRSHTLKFVREQPFLGLFRDLKGATKFEASGVSLAKDAFWVVFDSLREIGKVDLHFTFKGADNVLVGERGDESQFEGLSYMASVDRFLVVRESFAEEGHALHPWTEELEMSANFTTYTIIRKCRVEFSLQDTNKGFEGVHYFEQDGDQYILGLCESNFCHGIVNGSKKGEQSGHGRIVVARLELRGNECEWVVVKVVHIPKRADFTDYSGMGLYGNVVAITSQEDASVWISEFDFESLEFVSKGTVYHFPRNPHCSKIYCNVEGVQFLDDIRLVFASDKSKLIQPAVCMEKDQSIHVFALPKKPKLKLSQKPAPRSSSDKTSA